jgi:hypothetical protein
VTERNIRVVQLATWAGPLLWTIPWATFRGLCAHGGYLWWKTVHFRGLLVLLVLGLVVRSGIWWTRRGRPRVSARAHVAAQGSLVAVVVIVTWISFQTGLALHDPPDSLGDFLWQVP